MDKFEYSSNSDNGFEAHVKRDDLIITQNWYEEEPPHNKIFDEWRYDISNIDTVEELDTFTQNKFKELNG